MCVLWVYNKMSWNVEDRHIGKLILNLQAVKFNFNVIFVYNL